MKWLILGCGNMAQAVVPCFDQEGHEFTCFTPSFQKALELSKNLERGKVIKNLEINETFDFVFLGMKPQQLKEVAPKLRSYMKKDSILVSVLAGTSLETLASLWPNKKVIRIMPNTPIAHGHGVSLITSLGPTKEEVRFFTESLRKKGEVIELNGEEQLDALTGMYGSGPAYLFKLCESFSSWNNGAGIESSEHQRLFGELLIGAGTLLKESKKSAKTLRQNVTSKNGVTQKGLESLESSLFENIIHEALSSAYRRAIELKNE